MAEQNFNNAIDLGVSISDDNLKLSIREMNDIFHNEEFKNKMDTALEEFRSYLASLSGINHIGYYDSCLSIIIDKDYKPQLVFSPKGYTESVLTELGPLIYFFRPETPSQSLSRLFDIKNPEELKQSFPNLYMHSYLPNLFYGNKNKGKVFSIITRYENRMKDPYLKEKITKEETAEYLKAKSTQSFVVFRKCAYDYYKEVSERHEEIIDWMKTHKITMDLGEEENKKLFLYLIKRQMESIYENAQQKGSDAAQKSLIIFEGLIKKYKEKYPNDDTKFEYYASNILTNTLDNIEQFNSLFDAFEGLKGKEVSVKTKTVISIKIIESELQGILEAFPYLKQNVVLPEVDKSLTFEENQKRAEDYISNIINETINEDKEQGARDATEEVHKRIEELNKEIESESISVKDKKEKNIILKKIKMALYDIKPLKIQTGTGKVFKDYYVYYYPNGMVALDRTNGYGALYIMPVHIYKEARYKNNLTEVKNIPGVERVHHKNKDWLSLAKGYLEKGSPDVTEEDIRKTEEVASIDFPYTIEQLKELEKSFAESGNEKGVKEAKRRIRKTKELEKVDTELKDNEFNTYDDIPIEKRQKVEQLDGEKEDVLNSDEIDEMAFSEKSFEELYEEWKKNHEKKKNSRNPVVSAITKRRSMNEFGNYCCEWCGAEYVDTRPLRSHHVRPLSQGGPDNIYNTVCICPNCHDYVHSHVMTNEQQYRLFEVVRRHIEEENPEYLPQFYDLISPIAKDQEDYKNNKERIDSNFERQWSAGKVIFKR